MSGAVFYAIFYASSANAPCGLRLKVTNKMPRPMTSVSMSAAKVDQMMPESPKHRLPTIMNGMMEKPVGGHVKEF